MSSDELILDEEPLLTNTRMVMGFSGWMDGGEVSTGTIEYLVDHLGATRLGEIEPSDFYIYNVPGSMEISALFRPGARIEDGLVEDFIEPTNIFYYSEEHNLILFSGKEPNIRWKSYADCIFSVVETFDVRMMSYIGSVSSLIPHTREPRYHSSSSSEEVRELVVRLGLHPTNYEGPASLVTYLVTRARECGLPMATIVAEVPGYIQGRNTKSMSFVIRKLGGLLNMDLDLDELDALNREFDERLNEIVKRKPDMEKHIRRLEEDYDNEIVSMGGHDLQSWFEKQNIRLN